MNMERELIAEKISEWIIPESCNGNKDAEAYLKRVFYIVRKLDDLQDEDFKVEKEELIRAYFFLFADLATNKFYLQHQAMLSSLHAWQDSNIWAGDPDQNKRLYAHVIRDFICELFILVAYLCGGEKLMRGISLKIREAFLKDPEF